MVKWVLLCRILQLKMIFFSRRLQSSEHFDFFAVNFSCNCNRTAFFSYRTAWWRKRDKRRYLISFVIRVLLRVDVNNCLITGVVGVVQSNNVVLLLISVSASRPWHHRTHPSADQPPQPPPTAFHVYVCLAIVFARNWKFIIYHTARNNVGKLCAELHKKSTHCRLKYEMHFCSVINKFCEMYLRRF